MPLESDWMVIDEDSIPQLLIGFMAGFAFAPLSQDPLFYIVALTISIQVTNKLMGTKSNVLLSFLSSFFGWYVGRRYIRHNISMVHLHHEVCERQCNSRGCKVTFVREHCNPNILFR